MAWILVDASGERYREPAPGRPVNLLARGGSHDTDTDPNHDQDGRDEHGYGVSDRAHRRHAIPSERRFQLADPRSGSEGRLAARPKVQNTSWPYCTDAKPAYQLRTSGLGTGSIDGAMCFPGGSMKIAQATELGEPAFTTPVTRPAAITWLPRPSLQEVTRSEEH